MYLLREVVCVKWFLVSGEDAVCAKKLCSMGAQVQGLHQLIGRGQLIMSAFPGMFADSVAIFGIFGKSFLDQWSGAV